MHEVSGGMETKREGREAGGGSVCVIIIIFCFVP